MHAFYNSYWCYIFILQGNIGIAGEKGLIGPIGLPGEPGKSGVDGVKGQPGTAGLEGLAGQRGASGVDGTNVSVLIYCALFIYSALSSDNTKWPPFNGILWLSFKLNLLRKVLKVNYILDKS